MLNHASLTSCLTFSALTVHKCLSVNQEKAVVIQTIDSPQHSARNMCKQWWRRRWQQSVWETQAT